MVVLQTRHPAAVRTDYILAKIVFTTGRADVLKLDIA